MAITCRRLPATISLKRPARPFKRACIGYLSVLQYLLAPVYLTRLRLTIPSHRRGLINDL